jgi:WD40 repeat protein
VWQLSDGAMTGHYQHTGEVLSVAYAPDGKTMVAGAADKSIKAWRVVE